jgi:ABC-type transport system involved in cytochrome c biogenesis permease subunit
MPALQSPYFIPHVTLYILSYAVLAAAALGSVMILVKRRKAAKRCVAYKERSSESQEEGGEKSVSEGGEKRVSEELNSIKDLLPNDAPAKDLGKDLLDLVDNLTYVGTGFLMLGLILGALWAKEAWGHYWSWDPKETWAFTTAAAFLLYIHLRKIQSKSAAPLLVLPLAFIFLMITWLGVSFLPTANLSVHAY